jgi:hypothetical protein
MSSPRSWTGDDDRDSLGRLGEDDPDLVPVEQLPPRATVRDLTAAIRHEVRAGDLAPGRAGELATQLAALLANICAEIRAADMAYNEVFADMLDQEGKANRAKIRAELTPAYARKREAHDEHTVTLELIRSLRKMQDTFREEMRLQR